MVAEATIPESLTIKAIILPITVPKIPKKSFGYSSFKVLKMLIGLNNKMVDASRLAINTLLNWYT